MKPFYKIYMDLLSNPKHKAAIKLVGMNHIKEVWKWIGDAIFTLLPDIPKPQMAELKKFAEAWEKVPMVPKRGGKKAKKAADGGGKAKKVESEEEEEEEEDDEPAMDMANLDPYDLADPVDIFKIYHEGWTEKVLELSKWNEKKKMVDEFLAKAENTIKFANTSYSHLMALSKKLFMDTNQNVTISTIKMNGAIAKGLRKNFHRSDGRKQAGVLIEKLKDKNPRILTEIYAAFDCFY